jgi:branched-chain amino acid transport system permease protein
MSASSNPVAVNTLPEGKPLVTPRQLTLVCVVLLALSWGFLPEFTVSVLANIGLYSLVAAGLVMLTGVGGMTSFGQAAFVGMGAYATAWICTSPVAAGWLGAAASPALLPWAGLLLGLVFTFALAWMLGAVTLKLQGHYLPLCTIAWGLSLYYLLGNMDFLGGQTGITGVPPLVIAGVSLATPRMLGVVIWAVLLLALWALHNLLDSREGRAIRALKGGRLMAESMGVDTARHRIKLFVLAALLAAVSGWLYAHMQRFVNPTPFNLNIGIELLFMAVVGGAGHLWGAVLGATLITLLKEKLQDWLPALLGTSGNFEVIVFGLLMLFVLQRFSDGLWPTVARLASRWVRAVPKAQAQANGAKRPVASTQDTAGTTGPAHAARHRHAAAAGRHREQALRRPGGQQRDLHDAEGGRDPCADRPERRRQEHLLQHDLGRGRPRARARCAWWARPCRASPRAPSPRAAWAAPSSTCVCWGSAACSRTWRSAPTCAPGAAGSRRPCGSTAWKKPR